MQIHLHANATTTPKIRAAIQASLAPVAALAAEYGVTERTVRRWKERDSVEDRVRRSEERAKRDVPLGRTGRLKEVGYLALYLASSASDYMTGQTLMLDGGMSL